MEVLIEDDIKLYEHVKKTLSGGHILAVYTEADKLYAENMISALVREYRITKKILPTKVESSEDIAEDIADAPDDIRLVIVIGGIDIIEDTRVACTIMGVPYIVVQTCACKLIEDRAYIFCGNILECKRVTLPQVLLLDRSAIRRKGNIEYIIGDMAETLVASYDRLYSSVVGGAEHDSHDINNIMDVMESLDESNKDAILDSGMKLGDISPHIISQACRYLAHNGKSGKNMASYKFGMAYTILLLYRGYMNASQDDLLYPPDIVGSAKIISKTYGIDISSIVLGFRMMSSNEYMRLIHVAKEYKGELLAVLDRAVEVMSHASKVYRRVSRDAGYRMNDDIKLDEIERNISLFSLYEENNTPLRMMKIGGFLERYIEK